MAARLEVALPVTIAFVFGLAMGLVVGHLVTKGGQVRPEAPRVGEAAPVEAPEAGGHDEGQIRRALDVHLELLKASPDDVHLLRTVGNYHAMLSEHDQALALYTRAEELARASGTQSQELAQVLVDSATVHAEQGDLPEAIRRLDEAVALDATDTRSRMSLAYVYLVKVMPQPPPGFDRREAVHRAEALLDEVLALDPGNADARQFKDLIVGVRQQREAGAPPARETAAPR